MDATFHSASSTEGGSSSKVVGMLSMTPVSLAGRTSYQNIMEGGVSSKDPPSPLAEGVSLPSPVTRRAKARNSLSLLLDSASSSDSIEIPQSINDTSTVSSFQVSPRSLEPLCCYCCGTVKHYLVVSALLSFTLFVWCAALGFLWGLFLGLISFNLDLLYLYTYVRNYNAIGNMETRRRKQLRILHGVAVAFTTLVVIWLFIRLTSARTYIKNGFPSRCYPNALGTVPPACVHVASQDLSAPYAHGLIAPLYQTSSVSGVAGIVREWASHRMQTRLIPPAWDSFLHFVIISGFWGFTDDLVIQISCEPGGQVAVHFHSEQRLGTLDGDVNINRVRSLLHHLSSRADGLPPGNCQALTPS